MNEKLEERRYAYLYEDEIPPCPLSPNGHFIGNGCVCMCGWVAPNIIKKREANNE